MDELLVLADVPTDRIIEIEESIKRHLPTVEIEGSEPLVPISLINVICLTSSSK